MSELETKLTFHLINPKSTTIQDALTGLAWASRSRLTYDASANILYRSDICNFKRDHVTIVAAAGGGHEPMFAGYVGYNGVSAFVSGAVFAAPTGVQMLTALRTCSSPKGSLLVVGNYTGDILNAGLAITRAKAEGIKVHLLVVGDDVAVGRRKGAGVGRRGLCGHLIALKIICPMAEEGIEIEKVSEAAQWIVERVGTIATAFDRCALPSGLVTSLPALPPDTVELGMGAHGEPGLVRISPTPEPHDLVKRMVKLLIDRTDEDRGFLEVGNGSSVVLMVNNLGSTSSDLMAEFAALAKKELEGAGINVLRAICGPLVTSLRMSGIGLAIGLIPDVKDCQSGLSREKFLRYWDSVTGTVVWHSIPNIA